MCSQLLRTCIGQVWMSVLGIIICKKKEMEWRNSLYPPDPQLLVDLYCCQSRENSRKRNRWKEETGGACNYKIPVRVQRQHSVLDRHSISFSISIVLIHIAYTRIVMCLEGGHTLPTSTSRKQWVSSFGVSCSLSCDKCRGLNGWTSSKFLECVLWLVVYPQPALVCAWKDLGFLCSQVHTYPSLPGHNL